MSSLGNRLNNGSGLLRALDAASNWRAIAIYLVASVLYFGFILLGGMTESRVGFGLMWLIGFIVAFIGVSAAGHLLMDQARNITPRTVVDAILAGVFTLHRLVGLFLIALVSFVLLALVIAVLLLLSKIPGIGPALYTVVFPVGTVVLGVAAMVLFYVVIGLLAPSVWEGNGVLASLARLWTIIRERLLQVTVNMFLLTLLVSFVGLVILGILLTGGLFMASMAISIIGYEAQGELMSLLSVMQGVMTGYMPSVSGYVAATMYGAGLLYLIAISVITVILLSGFCQIYLQATEGLAFDAAEAQINQGLEEAKRRAQEAQARAKEASERARAAGAAATPAPVAATAPATPGLQCPQCQAPATADDVFCGECGYKLKA